MPSKRPMYSSSLFLTSLTSVLFLIIGVPITVGQGLAIAQGRPEVSLAVAAIILLVSALTFGAALKKLRAGDSNGIPLACCAGAATVVLVMAHASSVPLAPCTTTCLLPDSSWSVFGLYTAWTLLPAAVLCTAMVGTAFGESGRPSLRRALIWDNAPGDTDIADLPERVSVFPTVVALICYTALGISTYIATSGFTALHEFSDFNSTGVAAYSCVLVLAIGLSHGLAVKERGDRAILAGTVLALFVVAAHFLWRLDTRDPMGGIIMHLLFAVPALWPTITAARNLLSTRTGESNSRSGTVRANGTDT